MSLYRYFPSKNTLPEVQSNHLQLVNENNQFLYIEEQNIIEHFEVVSCRRNPPIAAIE